MLSRFSSLFTYVIVGLVISAAATPLNPLGNALGDGTKSLSRPNSMKSNEGQPMGGDRDKGKPMGGDRDKGKPMGGDRDKGKPMGGDREKGKPMGGDRDKDKGGDRDRDGGDRDKGKPFGDNDNDNDKSYDDKDKPYGDKDKHYDDDRSERHGQCSVEKQHCCNQVNQASETSKLDSLGSSILGLDVLVGLIKESNQLWGFDCSPLWGFNSACNNQQVCCEDTHQNGLIVVGCNNINLI